MENGKSSFLIRRGSVAAVLRTAMILLVVVSGAVAIVQPLPASVPAHRTVSPADSSQLNPLEPAKTATVSGSSLMYSQRQGVERVVGEWTPTGGITGGGGSQKH